MISCITWSHRSSNMRFSDQFLHKLAILPRWYIWVYWDLCCIGVNSVTLWIVSKGLFTHPSWNTNLWCGDINWFLCRWAISPCIVCSVLDDTFHLTDIFCCIIGPFRLCFLGEKKRRGFYINCRPLVTVLVLN